VNPPQAPPREQPAAPKGILTLQAAIAFTLLANPDLQSALARESLAEATLARARSDFFPLLSANENYQASDNVLRKFQFFLAQGQTSPLHFFHPPPVVDNFQSELEIAQNIYTGGLRLARSRSAAADVHAAHFALEAVQNRLVFQVAEAYYRLFQTNALREVRREAVAQTESQVEAVRSRLRAQTATRAELFQVELRLAEVREGLITARNQVSLSWALLENLTGARLAGYALPATLPPPPWADHSPAVERAIAGAPEATGEDAEVEASVAAALRGRPEVGQGDSQQRAAEFRVRAAQAGKYPSISAVADYDHFTGTGGASDTFFLGLAASLNLFDGHRTRNSVRQAEAQVREIVARNRRLQLDIELDVRRAYLQRKDARERLNVTSSSVRDAAENLRQTRSRFANQTATVTELLAAQVALSDARVRDVQVCADVEIASAELERAVGRLARFLRADAVQSAP
jgi:OMF family outer membrane factor